MRELKTFLDLDPQLPSTQLINQNSKKHVRADEGWPLRREQYEFLVAMVRPDAQRYVGGTALHSIARDTELQGTTRGAAWCCSWGYLWWSGGPCACRLRLCRSLLACCCCLPCCDYPGSLLYPWVAS